LRGFVLRDGEGIRFIMQDKGDDPAVGQRIGDDFGDQSIAFNYEHVHRRLTADPHAGAMVA
jgi:hypothetical protein